VQGRPSAWWWLLPPVMYVLHRRWYKALRQAMLPQLTQTQRDQVTRFQSKSTGWFTVAAGAALLAMGETWQIIQHYRWPVWAFWLLVAVMLAVAVLTTTVLMIGDALVGGAGEGAGQFTGEAAPRKSELGRGETAKAAHNVSADRLADSQSEPPTENAQRRIFRAACQAVQSGSRRNPGMAPGCSRGRPPEPR
jgi:TolA-binding protein